MPHISIISSGQKTGRHSHRVALYFKNYLKETNLATAEILDLNNYNFSNFTEGGASPEKSTAQALEFAEKVKLSDGVIIVTPEHEGGFPPSLKNVINLFTKQWHRKPIATSTISSGVFSGSQVIASLQFLLWKIGAWTVPAAFRIPQVQEAFDESGNARNKIETNKQADAFIKQLFWYIEAN